MVSASPSDFRRHLTRRANQISRTTGRSAGDLLQQHYLARLTARVFHDDPHGWLIKGGQAMLVRYPNARHSRDVDLVYSAGVEPDMDEAIATLRRAATVDLNDYLRFEFLDCKQPALGASGRKVRFNAYIGTIQVIVLGVDLVVDHQPIGKSITRQLEPVIDLDEITVWPKVRLYPIVDHLADKICAIIERHGKDNLPSARYRDLVDLVLIIQTESIDGHDLHDVLRTEIRRRQARGTVITLPDRFDVPNAYDWESGYRKQAKNVTNLDEFRTLDQAVLFGAAFVDPLLGPNPPGTWNPEDRRWH